MKRLHHRIGSWFARLILRIVSIMIVLALLPWLISTAGRIMLNISNHVTNASVIIERRLSESAMLETTQIDITGKKTSVVNALLIGKVGSVAIDYQYHASVGIDLRDVTVQQSDDGIVLYIPHERIIDDSIDATNIDVQRFWMPYWSANDTNKLLQQEKAMLREQETQNLLLNGNISANTQHAILSTIGQWQQVSGVNLIIRRIGD